MYDIDATLTDFLLKWNDGDEQAMNDAVSAAYTELHRIAEVHFRESRPGKTFQPTALVHEAYIRLLSSRMQFGNRNQFFWFMGKLMRHILTDHLRAKLTAKRGSGKVVNESQLGVSLPEISGSLSAQQFLDLDLALQRLAGFDRRQSQILEMYYLCNLKIDDIAENLKISTSTVKRDLKMAKAWLANQMSVA